jgi:hypothetical protein
MRCYCERRATAPPLPCGAIGNSLRSGWDLKPPHLIRSIVDIPRIPATPRSSLRLSPSTGSMTPARSSGLRRGPTQGIGRSSHPRICPSDHHAIWPSEVKSTDPPLNRWSGQLARVEDRWLEAGRRSLSVLYRPWAFHGEVPTVSKALTVATGNYGMVRHE